MEREPKTSAWRVDGAACGLNCSAPLCGAVCRGTCAAAPLSGALQGNEQEERQAVARRATVVHPVKTAPHGLTTEHTEGNFLATDIAACRGFFYLETRNAGTANSSPSISAL